MGRVAVWAVWCLMPSWGPQDDSLVLSRGVTLGMKMGPPISQAYWLKRKGAGARYCDARGLWLRVQSLASRAELRKFSTRSPWKLSVPLLVTKRICPPEDRPYSAL